MIRNDALFHEHTGPSPSSVTDAADSIPLHPNGLAIGCVAMFVSKLNDTPTPTSESSITALTSSADRAKYEKTRDRLFLCPCTDAITASPDCNGFAVDTLHRTADSAIHCDDSHMLDPTICFADQDDSDRSIPLVVILVAPVPGPFVPHAGRQLWKGHVIGGYANTT